MRVGKTPVFVDIDPSTESGRYKVEGSDRWFPFYDERPHAAPANRAWFPCLPSVADQMRDFIMALHDCDFVVGKPND